MFVDILPVIVHGRVLPFQKYYIKPPLELCRGTYEPEDGGELGG